MKKLTLIAVSTAIAATAALPALAESSVAAGTAKTLKTQLTKQGYEVRRMEMDKGLIEVYALKNGKRMELFFDKSLKQVKGQDSD